MAETLLKSQPAETVEPHEFFELDISNLITEDDTPVDNIFSEKQQRLLTESLISSWKPGRSFVAAANVGVFYSTNQPPIVPDAFVSMDVQVADDLWKKKNRSYMVWEFGKPPDVAVEIVSNTKGGENTGKLLTYSQVRVLYYVIFDPQRLIQSDDLRIYEFSAGQYIPKIDRRLTQTGLGVTIWEGVFEGKHGRWLRWTDNEGNLIQTGLERAELAEKNAGKERQRAELAEKNAKHMADQLRALGINPDELLKS